MPNQHPLFGWPLVGNSEASIHLSTHKFLDLDKDEHGPNNYNYNIILFFFLGRKNNYHKQKLTKANSRCLRITPLIIHTHIVIK